MSHLAKILTLPSQPRPSAREHPFVDPATGERRARWVMLAILAGALGFFALGAYLDVHEKPEGIHELAPAVRLSLYQRTLKEVETVCLEPAARAGALRDHCAAQARFVEQLPECTDACRRSANAMLPHARR
jgi:hypothetical protein